MDNGTRILSISASSGYTAARGFGYFLTQYCGCMVSWAGRQLNVPRPLPELSAKVKVTSYDRSDNLESGTERMMKWMCKSFDFITICSKNKCFRFLRSWLVGYVLCPIESKVI